MTNQERQLFKNLTKFKEKEFDESLLGAATPTVLGQLFFNRMQAIAYGVMKEHDVLGKVNREFRNSLRTAYERNLEKNRSFFWCVQHLSKILSACTCKYAMLKGAVLCRYYPSGYRTSNDIDLLVMPEHVTEIGNVLERAGFQQGNIRSDRFVPASRREIIESKMMRGETVPYIKQMDLPGMKFLEVDINFSLDYKNGDTVILQDLLQRVHTQDVDGLQVMTLDKDDFFIHLCGHLYKEATTLPWVEMNRDMTLYKYSDIYMLLSDMTDSEQRSLFVRAKQYGMEKICSFAILQTAILFDMAKCIAIEFSESVLQNDPHFLHTVISPADKKELVYEEKDVNNRFFSENRSTYLKVVNEG